MLTALFGNQNIERILLFLFVNGKCYGAQLHRMLRAPLTPIQKALSRLEKGGLVTSYYEGKTRVYRFNPGFSPLSELQALLKKTYTLLPPEEKKLYYLTQETQTLPQNTTLSKLGILQEFWSRLGRVKQVSFFAQSKQKHGWSRRGTGEVLVEKQEPSSLIFQESGLWKNTEGQETKYSNAIRWTLDRVAGVIALEHLRRGVDHPVFLFHLAPSSKQSLASVDSHLCEEDTYFGQVHFDPQGLRLNWRVIGPNKNEEINCYYV
ncbi:MAG: DUF6314 family protein [Simkaniaceae bacterium]|nr:DUF6314 family protein [Candidatus Sacchlamyda saccharinae]